MRSKPTAESVLRAEALRRLYRPETKVEFDRLVEAVGQGDKARIRDFLEGKGGALTEAELRGLSDVYRRYQAKGVETHTALSKALTGIEKERLGELKRLVPEEFREGLTANTIQRLGLLESQKAAGMSKVSLEALPEAVRGDLVGEHGPWERYLKANPEAKVSDREAALTDLANLVDRAHKELAGESDREARLLVMDLARIAASDISVLREVSAIAPKLHSTAIGKDVAKTLDGLRTALLAAQYARSSDRTLARAELALQISKGNAEKAKLLETALERAETKHDPQLLKEIRERFKDLLENEDSLSGAKTLAELMIALERRIAEEKGDVLQSLRELRDFVEAKRLVLALNEIEAFRKMDAESKVATAACVMRSAGMRTPLALAGAASGLAVILAITPSQFQTMVAKMGGFRLPEKVLTGGNTAVVRAGGPNGGNTVSSSGGGGQ